MSIVASRLSGARVLDLFAGSGALGLEALSRGATSVTFVELSPRSLRALHDNVRSLGVDSSVTIHRTDAVRYVERLEERAFDVAFADPPYTIEAGATLVERFQQRPFATILGVEHSADRPLPGGDTRRYGDTALTFCVAP